MKATFDNTVDILVKAYLNNTLKHGDCTACAVGNILGRRSQWNRLFVTPCDGPVILPQKFAGEGELLYGVITSIKIESEFDRQLLSESLELISESGYTVQELAMVENAFESAPRGKNQDEWMFNGLMNVVDTLAIIHNIDLSSKEEAKKLFVKI